MQIDPAQQVDLPQMVRQVAGNPAAGPTPTDSAEVEALRVEIDNLQVERSELHEELRRPRRRVDTLESSRL